MARTKTVSTIEYNKNGYELRIPLKLVTEAASYRGSVPTLSYLIEIEHPTEIRLSGKDPQELVTKLIAKLDEVCSVTWEPWLLVKTDSGRNQRESSSEPGWSAGLDIGVDYVLIGTNADGKNQFVHYDGTQGPDLAAAEKRCHYKRSGLPVTGRQTKWQGRDHGPDMGANTALIRDTPEHRAQLQRITDALVQIGAQVSEVLSPETIELSLQNVAPLLTHIPGTKESPDA